MYLSTFGMYVYILCALLTIFAYFTKRKELKALLSLLCLCAFVSISLIIWDHLEIYYQGRNVFLYLLWNVAGAFVCMTFAWSQKKFNEILKHAIIVFGGAIAISAIYAGLENYKKSIPEGPGEEIDLSLYKPFDANTLAKDLNEESSLKLTENMPRLDGATALYPLYSAFARAVYPEGDYAPYKDFFDPNSERIVACSKTGGAFENLIEGAADVVFLMGVSDNQRELAEGNGLELRLTPIGREAFVFFVNRYSFISNITSRDIVRIYSGEITNWREVGGPNDEILAYQRPAESGSQTALLKVMGGVPLDPTPNEDLVSTMKTMFDTVANYKNYRNSLGYSFLYYISEMITEKKVKFLSIDGIEPNKENIVNGSYPFAEDFYAVTAKRDGKYLNAERTENIDRFIDWVLSPQGQYLTEETGFAAIN
jgi:phosphate transport system substrate-binding protein